MDIRAMVNRAHVEVEKFNFFCKLLEVWPKEQSVISDHIASRDRLIATCREIIYAAQEERAAEPESLGKTLAEIETPGIVGGEYATSKPIEVEPLRGDCRKDIDTGKLFEQSFVPDSKSSLAESRGLYQKTSGGSWAIDTDYASVDLVPGSLSKNRKGVCMARDGKFLGHTLEWGTDNNERAACVAKAGEPEESDQLVVVELREVQ